MAPHRDAPDPDALDPEATAAGSAGPDYVLDIPVALRWGDMDINNHINNVQISRIFEESRVRSFYEWMPDRPRKFSFLVARQDIEFSAPVHYSLDPVHVRTCIGRVGRSSFVMALRLFDQSGTLCATAETTMVVVDPDTGRPTPIPDDARPLLTARLGEPVRFHTPRSNAAG
ncbi:thioesterase family protein [Gordonia hongkongensis]|uniref:Acyl-CoA thioesterase n=1 Tax=Gordonia hongkongensis TaxID=1701090 RepID=A0AAX3T253_9ACTN|nr:MULTISPECIES: thioesterase family protein [Gordonia]OCW84296.1 thioesterase [Nocardia farcinica]QIK47767.1 acyl-CoA thioesterase [Gordonia terrae]MBR7193308.1 acyl-CoA thioesterase [Gordonia sp. SCSIO 19800]MCT1355273.1 acyl-CoA thioesterase [Gordonia sp. p3-SID1431]MCX2754855.1 thioesterase family protein [Gordonia sp. 4N]